MTVSSRRTVFSELPGYCCLANKSDFIELTEWTNGEGFDIVVNSQSSQQTIQLTHGELDLISVLAKYRGESNE